MSCQKKEESNEGDTQAFEEKTGPQSDPPKSSEKNSSDSITDTTMYTHGQQVSKQDGPSLRKTAVKTPNIYLSVPVSSEEVRKKVKVVPDDSSCIQEIHEESCDSNLEQSPQLNLEPMETISSIPLEQNIYSTSNQPLKMIPPYLCASSSLRRGKWTPEEEAYVARVIRDFNYGYLDAPAGTTLRTYLSEKLHCDPMRITKKFTGDSCIGKRVFHPAVRCVTNAEAIERAQIELDELEKRWRIRLEIQQREASKKMSPASSIGLHKDTYSSLQQPLGGPSITTSTDVEIKTTRPKASLTQNVLERTATWLDRASNVLSNSSTDFERQISEVKQLLHEGPIIQKTSAGIPQLLGNERISIFDTSKSSCTDGDTCNPSTLKRSLSQVNLGSNITVPATTYQHQECVYFSGSSPHSKNIKKSWSTNCLTSLNKESGAEEVEALVGFFKSVRHEAPQKNSKNSKEIHKTKNITKSANKDLDTG